MKRCSSSVLMYLNRLSVFRPSPAVRQYGFLFTGRIEAPYVMTVVYQHLLVVFCPPGYAIGKAHHRYVLVFVPKRKVYSLGKHTSFRLWLFRMHNTCGRRTVCHELVGRGEFRHFRRRGSDFPAFSGVYIYDEHIFGSRVVPLARCIPSTGLSPVPIRRPICPVPRFRQVRIW